MLSLNLGLKVLASCCFTLLSIPVEFVVQLQRLKHYASH